MSRVRNLRHEYDAMRLQYDDRIRRLEAQLKQSEEHSRPNAKIRIRELETQIEEMRALYRKKNKNNVENSHHSSKHEGMDFL